MKQTILALLFIGLFFSGCIPTGVKTPKDVLKSEKSKNTPKEKAPVKTIQIEAKISNLKKVYAEDEKISFDGSDSYSTNGKIASYEFGYKTVGGKYQRLAVEQKKPSITKPIKLPAGTYKLALRVSEKNATINHTERYEFKVVERPKIIASIPDKAIFIQDGKNITLDVSKTTNSKSLTFTYYLNSDKIEGGVNIAIPLSQLDAGTHTIRIKATDKHGISSSKEIKFLLKSEDALRWEVFDLLEKFVNTKNSIARENIQKQLSEKLNPKIPIHISYRSQPTLKQRIHRIGSLLDISKSYKVFIGKDVKVKDGKISDIDICIKELKNEEDN
jgi:hypothetical protein